MNSRRRLRRPGSFVRDALVATLVVVGCYGLADGVQFQPLQVPGYLVVVFFGFVEEAVGPVTGNFDLVFALYLLGLGLVGGAVAQGLRRLAPAADGWRPGVASALVLVAIMAFAFGVAVLVGSDQLVPVAIAAATGLVAVGVAASLLGVVGLRVGPRPE